MSICQRIFFQTLHLGLRRWSRAVCSSGISVCPFHTTPEATQASLICYSEARNDPSTAPTSVYLGGGPGYTTFDGSAVFPCYFNSDGNSTTLNEHSWNENTNMLYIDQPLGVGFSYINLANGTYDLMKREFTKLDDGEDLPELNVTLRQATLNYGLNETLTNTTMSTARTLWRFAQVFFNE
jgi:hypothetical protein